MDANAKEVKAAVDEIKAEQWSVALTLAMKENRFTAEEAACHSGRLGFACMVAAGKIGRAYVRPFFAQASEPLPGLVVSAQLENAAHWWSAYLWLNPTIKMKVGECVTGTVWA